MILELLEKAAVEDNGFVFVNAIQGYRFYKKIEADHKRFLIICNTANLLSATDYNVQIEDVIPEELSNEPSFEKNTDFIIALELENLGEFKFHEQNIFSIEEDPFYYKKFVLYYSKEELGFVNNFNLSDLKKTVLNRDLFNNYKKDPNFSSKYSFAARFFIKTPFLKVPVEEEKLQSVETMLKEALIDKDLQTFEIEINNLILKSDGNIHDIIKEYENE